MNDHEQASITSVQDHYAHLAHEYEQRANKSLTARVEHEVSLRIPKKDRFLDLGCGTGWLVKRFISHQIFGIDESLPMLRHHALSLKHRLLIGNLENMPFKSNSCHLASSINSAEHVYHVTYLWREAFRILVPGGKLLVITPAGEKEKLLNLLERFHLKLPEGPHRFLNQTELTQDLTSAGFNPVRVQRILAFPIGGKRGLRCSMLMERFCPSLGFFLLAEAFKPSN